MSEKRLFTELFVPAGGDASRPAEILVEGGRIAAVASPGEVSRDLVEVVSLGGRLVLPGAIDGHVHFDDPGFTHRETFETGTRAAAAGGVTTVVDMPCTSLPPVTSAANLRSKLAIVAPKAHVDFMFWGGVSGNSICEESWRRDVADLVSEGVAAFKLYLLSGMETYRDLSPDEIRDVLEELVPHGLPAGIHAEERALVLESAPDAQAGGIIFLVPLVPFLIGLAVFLGFIGTAAAVRDATSEDAPAAPEAAPAAQAPAAEAAPQAAPAKGKGDARIITARQ